MFQKCLPGSALLLFLTLNAHAQGIPVTDTADDDPPAMPLARDTTKPIRELQPLEVRALRVGKLSAFAKTDISKTELEKINLGQDIPVLLQFTPSAQITSDAGTGIGYTGIRIRGTDPSRINVTFNGMPVNDPEEQATFFVDIPDIASSTSSIQIQRGAGTSTNGPGAFGATISIANLTQMDSAGAAFQTTVGSYNTIKNTLSAGTGRLTGGWQFDVRLSRISSSGYINRSAANLKSLQFVAGWSPTSRTSFHFLFMPGAEKTGQACNGVPEDSLASNRRYNELGKRSDGTFYDNQSDNYYQNYFQLFGDHAFSSRLSAHVGLFLTRGKGYYEEYKTDQPYSSYYLPGVISNRGDTLFAATDLVRRLWLDNYYYGGVYSLMYTQKTTTLTLGGGWAQFANLGYGNIIWSQHGGVPDNYKWYQHDAQKNDANVYLKAEHTKGQFILYGDLQYRNIAYFMNGFRANPGLRPNVNYDFFNPKAGVTYLIRNNAQNRQHAYASIAIANREPNRNAFEADPSKLPQPERLTDVEAGYEITRSKWMASANGYYMGYDQQLVLNGKINDVGAYTQTNVSKSYRAGIELQASYAPLRWLRLGGNTTLSQNRIERFTEYIDNYDNGTQDAKEYSQTDISFSPSVIGAFVATVQPTGHNALRHWSVNWTTKFVGDQFLDNTSNAASRLKGYQYTNILLRYAARMQPFKEIAGSIQINNIFGSLYAANGYTYSYISDNNKITQNYYYPQAPANVLFAVGFKW